MLSIEKQLASGNNEKSLELCFEQNERMLASILSIVTKTKIRKEIKVKLLCHWSDSKSIAELWNKMTKGNYTWNNIRVVWDESPDFYVIINSTNDVFIPAKTVIFRMEPHMIKHNFWKEWRDPDDSKFFRVFRHENGDFNNNEWHLSLTYNELMNTKIDKSVEDVLSVIVSGLYRDEGHIKRTDFVEYLEKHNFPLHIYGRENRWNWKSYKGSLPSHCKEKGLFPYKYTFNAENYSIPNYYTEKLIDGILSECLTFYWGCPNVKEYIDENAFVVLGLSKFEDDMNTIKKAIIEDWWSQRIETIRKEKKRILNELQFFPRLEKLFKERGVL